MADNRPNSQTDFSNPRKDHYSYSYSYKTGGDTENGIPSVNTVEVNESVTEEIGPDGSKIIRRHQQEKQTNKITQVVTQRVIKRQYIDPNTGQIIEYDPNNELFANLPPETVFEEHTIISDDNPPIITTTTLSKTNNNSNKNLNGQFSNLNINTDGGGGDCVDNVANIYRHNQSIQQTTNKIEAAVAAAANLKIKSHPEDNQGYPEEKNMDYDPDDSYPDDDSPYEGLIQTPNDDDTYKSKRKSNRKKGALSDLIDNEQLINSGVSSSGSSSSPILFDPNLDMPFVSNQQQYSKSSYSHSTTTTKYNRQIDQNGQQTYTTVLPSSNIGGPGPATPRERDRTNYNYYQTIGKYQNQQLSIDPYAALNQSQIQAPHSHRSQQSIYQKHIHSINQQQSSPNLNNTDYEYPLTIPQTEPIMRRNLTKPDTKLNASLSKQSINSSDASTNTSVTSTSNPIALPIHTTGMSSSSVSANKNSIYLVDNQSSIIIHHHHFDSNAMRNQFRMEQMRKQASQTSLGSRRSEQGVYKSVSPFKKGVRFEDNDNYLSSQNYYRPQSAYFEHSGHVSRHSMNMYRSAQNVNTDYNIYNRTTLKNINNHLSDNNVDFNNLSFHNRSLSSIDSGINIQNPYSYLGILK
ncbi:unnamed protein product [Brachionus calyciflorus]|uniref:Uncharacterized protein n=1 Tax=Brachionus calyciflorus TaxID=104777 RepID=A0A813MXF0_9BILA|nr:unnamed protein product [Brachionus calyciflorus]